MSMKPCVSTFSLRAHLRASHLLHKPEAQAKGHRGKTFARASGLFASIAPATQA